MKIQVDLAKRKFSRDGIRDAFRCERKWYGKGRGS